MLLVRKISTRIFITALILLALAIAGVLIWQIQRSGSNTQGGWKQYINTQYGIRLNYPVNWGIPQMSSADFSQGKEYTINFNKFPSDNDISITMDTNNLSKKGCQMEAGCKVTAAYVRYLEGRFADKTTNLYSVLTSSKGTDTLAVYLIKDLPKLNVSAVKIQYSVKLEDNTCPDGVSNNSYGCIGDSIYREMAKVLNSISSA